MIRKYIYPLLVILLIIFIYFNQNEISYHNPKIYAIKSLYNYIYDPSRTYNINIYVDELLKDETFNFYLLQDDKKMPLEIKDIKIIGYNDLLNIKYLNYSLEFYIVEPLNQYKDSYLLLENNNYNYQLNIGIFYTYYSKEYNYLTYDLLEGIYDINLKNINLNIKYEINDLKIAPFIEIELIKNYVGYNINLSYDKYYYIYKTFLLINNNYLIDCPRFKITNLELNDYYNYLEEGICLK